MFQLLLLLGVSVVLVYASYYDLKTHTVRSDVLVLIMLLGILYLFNSSSMDALSSFANIGLLLLIFGFPMAFNRSWGDILVIAILGLFIQSQTQLTVFLAMILISAVVLAVVLLDRYGYFVHKKKIKDFEFAFIPAISIGFWSMMIHIFVNLYFV